MADVIPNSPEDSNPQVVPDVAGELSTEVPVLDYRTPDKPKSVRKRIFAIVRNSMLAMFLVVGCASVLMPSLCRSAPHSRAVQLQDRAAEIELTISQNR